MFNCVIITTSTTQPEQDNMTNQSIKFTKICAGEYEFGKYSISKDESESNLWWVKHEDFMTQEDFRTLKDAKDSIREIN